MKRRRFVKTSCCALPALLLVGTASLSGCVSLHYAAARRYGTGWVVARSEFSHDKKDRTEYRATVLIQNEGMDFPIAVHRKDEHTFTAVLMRCTHRGCELDVGGGILTCPCHGSEFTMEGRVLEGPAEDDLTAFKTDTDTEHVYVYSI